MSKKQFGKKQWIMVVMVLLLGAAVYLNYYTAGNFPTEGANAPAETSPTSEATKALGESQFVNNTTAAKDYFSTVRADRTKAREEALALIQETLRDVKADARLQKDMMEKAAAVAASVEQEDAVESLVKAKGYADCAVFIEDDRCHVAVKAASLSETETLQIAEIVMAQTDVSPSHINILAVE